MALWRNLVSTAAEIEHGGHHYRVELQLLNLGSNATLIRDGTVVERASTPARFALGDGATIVVDSTEHGFRVAELRGDGPARPLHPAAGTWEERRVAWGRRHPAADGAISAVTGIILLLSLGYGALSLLQAITSMGVIQDLLGGWRFTMPFAPGPIALIAWGLLVGASGADTALRMSPALRARGDQPNRDVGR